MIPTSRVIYRFAFLVFIASATSVVRLQGEEGPKWSRLFPSGGQRGTSVEVTLSGTFPKWPVMIWGSHPGITWRALEASGKIEAKVDPNAPVGVHWVRVFDANGSSDIRPWIVGSIPELVEKEPNDLVGQSQSFDPHGITINAILEKSGDVDTFSTKLSKGQRLVASVEANRNLRSPVDVGIQVMNERGNILAQNLDYRGLDPYLVFEAPIDGRYLVRTFGFPETPDSSIRYSGKENYLYRLTLTTGPYLEATLPLAVSTKEVSHLSVFSPLSDESKKISVPAHVDHDDASTTLAIPEYAGEITLPIVSASIEVENSAQSPTSPQEISIPSCISGRIGEKKERDAFRFAAKKESRWKFRLESRGIGFPMDPVLELIDAGGKQLVRQDDAGKDAPDPVIPWKCPQDGQYTLIVSDLYGAGGKSFFYRLWIEEEKPGVAMSVPSESIQGKVGQPIEIEVSLQRTSDFADDVSFAMEGLPATATFEPTISPGKGDSSKKVKLKLTLKEPYQGPIRLTGQAPSIGSKTVVAEKGTRYLWLSVVP